MVPLMSKFLWRKGYLRVPETCSVEQSGGGDETSCRASCPEEMYKTRGMSPYDVLMDVSAIHWFAETTKGTVVSITPFQSSGGRDTLRVSALGGSRMR